MLEPVLPAVTCPTQSSMLTGLRPDGHGIVANGWYDHDRAEPIFWKQSNHLVRGEKLWETARARDPRCTTANLFWWFNMYGTPDWSVTPRPAYPADGRKIPDCYSHPAELRDRLQAELGTFPLFRFWGPKADIVSSRWIAAAAERVLDWHRPTLQLVYLPHLDYSLQKVGPEHPSIPTEVGRIDEVVGELADRHLQQGYELVIVSEYGITPVRDGAFPNRALREAGLLRFRIDATGELLDHGASPAFAVPDHQVAHVYCRDEKTRTAAREALLACDGVDRVVEGAERAELGLDHPRAGDLVAFSEPDRWFAHDWWTDPSRAPDYQRTVDIHRKPGYDPRELYLDPEKPLAMPRLLLKVAARKLGFRNLLDFVPLDTSLVRGSHGLAPPSDDAAPVLMTSARLDLPDRLPQPAMRDFLLDRLFD